MLRDYLEEQIQSRVKAQKSTEIKGARGQATPTNIQFSCKHSIEPAAGFAPVNVLRC